VQPRELRADLNDLQSLGWLSFTTDRHGTTIQLREPGEAEQPQEEKPASGAATEGMEPFQVKNTASPDRALIHQFSAIYNLHRPSTWPSHEPSDSPSLGRLVQQAIDRKGERAQTSPEGHASVLAHHLSPGPQRSGLRQSSLPLRSVMSAPSIRRCGCRSQAPTDRACRSTSLARRPELQARRRRTVKSHRLRARLDCRLPTHPKTPAQVASTNGLAAASPRAHNQPKARHRTAAANELWQDRNAIRKHPKQ